MDEKMGGLPSQLLLLGWLPLDCDPYLEGLVVILRFNLFGAVSWRLLLLLSTCQVKSKFEVYTTSTLTRLAISNYDFLPRYEFCCKRHMHFNYKYYIHVVYQNL